ncbi:SH3 domain-containing protein [Candidatus Fermentibacteria bacterium]|nr:SH3 domain-containing protein [Candidatus Fermentibacteria bacterium]
MAVMLACAPPAAVLPPQSAAPAQGDVVAPPQAPTIAVAAKKGRTYANIRLFADSRSPVIAKVPVGTVLNTFGCDGPWHQVQVPATGALGWIHSVYLE